MQAQETLIETQRLLARRAWLHFAVTISLAGATAAAGCTAIWALGAAPYWLPWTAALAAAFVFALIAYRRPPAAADAALFLDLRCNLQERMSAFIAPGRSNLFPALVADLTTRLKSIDHRQAIGPLIPERASLLAAPIAVVIALVLVAGDVQNVAPKATLSATQAAESKANANASARLALLWRNLQEAKRRYAATRSEADRLALMQAQKAWEQEMTRWASAAGSRQKAAAGSGESSTVAKGGDVSLLRVAESIAGSDAVEKKSGAVQGKGPDWRTFAIVEETIPMAWRPGLRAYFDAIAAETLRREQETRKE